jgi:hypothetical protein
MLLPTLLLPTRNRLPSILTRKTVDSTVCGTRWCGMTIDSWCQYEQITISSCKSDTSRSSYVHFLYFHSNDLAHDFEGQGISRSSFPESRLNEVAQILKEILEIGRFFFELSIFFIFPGRWTGNWPWKSTNFAVNVSSKYNPRAVEQNKTKFIQMGLFIFELFAFCKSCQVNYNSRVF